MKRQKTIFLDDDESDLWEGLKQTFRVRHWAAIAILYCCRSDKFVGVAAIFGQLLDNC